MVCNGNKLPQKIVSFDDRYFNRVSEIRQTYKLFIIDQLKLRSKARSISNKQGST